LAIIVLGYTLYRNVYPYPTGDGHWFPIVGGIWLAVAIVGVIVAPRTARRLGDLAASIMFRSEHAHLDERMSRENPHRLDTRVS